MTGITFKGRLGNQLFQFCFYLYLKSNNKSKRVFIVNPHHSYISQYFDLGQYNFLLGSKLFSLITRNIPKISNFKNIYPQNFVAPKEYMAESKTIYNGYFQSEWYYLNAKEKVNISVKKKYFKEFQQLYGDLFNENKTIAVHIRRTDYLNYGKRDISLPIEYFKDQLNKIKNIDSYIVLFLSDDIEFVRTVFPKKENYIYSENTEIVDFQIIQHADIAIISNSSFAWWAAYLSPKENMVIAPQYWLGFRIGREHPKGIMTGKFNWKPVENNY